MSTLKKSATKSKFISEEMNDFLNDSQFLNDMPKNKKLTKRRINTEKEFQDLSQVKPTAPKKKKLDENFDACGESRQKTLNVMSRQLEVRKQIDENFLKNLSDLISNIEVDYDVSKENEQKLEHLTGCFTKCIQQATAVQKENIKTFKGLHAAFKKECENIEAEQNAEMDKLGGELEEDIRKLKQKLISETKRSEWENLQKSFFRAMQNNF